MAWKSAWRSRNSNYRYQYQQRPVRRKSRLLYKLGLFSFLATICFFLFSLVLLPIMAFNLPSPEKLVRREGFSTKIYDRNGVLLHDIYANERRSPVKFEDIPDYLKKATIAIEDKNFYKHQGYDVWGMIRGASRLFTSGRAQGGSTISQQLVKNVLLSSERSIIRKAQEIILTVQIERKYDKDEILTMYLNEAPYGGTAWGVEAASDVYFGKAVKDLNLAEAAILAGLPQRPTGYSPYGTDPNAYKVRTKQVLRRMQEDGFITEEQEKEALGGLAEVEFVGRGASFKAPHFITYVKDLLEEKYGASLIEQGGLKVTTTLDWTLQEKVQDIVSTEIEKVEDLHITNGAAVIMDPNNGHILAMVGSKDFAAIDYDGQVNVALALRQPGSAIKPVTYLTGIRKGYTAAYMLMDVPTVFPGGINQPDYTPVNYDEKYRGPIQVRYGLANSLNIPAVKMLSLVGVKEMLTTANELGLTTLAPTKQNIDRFGLSVTLGGGEVRLLDLVNAYSAFANGGKRFEGVSILKVEDAKGTVLEENKKSEGKEVITPSQAFIISNILSDNKARSDVFGLVSALNIPGREVAVKTGTTNDQRDNWTIGWTPQVIAGVWVGNNDNSQMKKVASGVTGSSPIWKKAMLAALDGLSNTGFEPPDDVVTAEVDSISGFGAHDGFPSRTEYFIRGTEPAGVDPIHTKLKVCKGQTGLATPSQVASGDYEEKEFFVFKEEDPTVKPGEENRWQKGIIDWIVTKDSIYNPPSQYCGAGNPLNVDFFGPRDHDQIDANTFEVKVDPRSTSEILQVEVELNGTKQATLTSAPWRMTLSGVKDGVHEILARAKDKNGNTTERKIKIGVNKPWDYSASTQ